MGAVLRLPARLLLFWPTALAVQAGGFLAERGGSWWGRLLVRPAFRLFCRLLLHARPLLFLRDGPQRAVAFPELSAILRAQGHLALIPCACRAGSSAPCGVPGHGPHEADTCISLGLAARIQAGAGVGRRIDAAEAEEICRRAAGSGLVFHAVVSFGRVAELCCCCPGRCTVFRAWRGGVGGVIRPAAAIARRGPSCDGCTGRPARVCEAACPYGLAPGRPDCLGCGRCAACCPRQAVEMAGRKP